MAVCSLNLMGVGGTWNATGDILFGQYGGPIMRVSGAGGVAAPVTVLDKSGGDVAHAEPWFLPDGRHFLYVRVPGMGADISVGSLDVKPEKQDTRKLVPASLGVSYAHSSDPDFGQMVLLRRQTLMAQSFDARHLKISGDPVRIVEEPVAKYYATGTFSTSSNGTLVYWSPGNAQSQLTWFDIQGKALNTVGSPGPYTSATLSPDGTRALLSRLEPDLLNMSLWLVDMSRGSSARVEIDPLKDGRAGVWTPDGRGIFFSSYRDGRMGDLYKKQMGGSAAPEALVSSNEEKFPLSLSLDGASCCTEVWEGQRKTSCGCFRFEAIGSQRRSFGRNRTSLRPVFLPTAAGWRTYRTNRAVMKFTCDPSRQMHPGKKSRMLAASG